MIKTLKNSAGAHFWTLFTKNMMFSQSSPIIIPLGYILAELAPGGVKNVVSTMYFAERLAKRRFLSIPILVHYI